MWHEIVVPKDTVFLQNNVDIDIDIDILTLKKSGCDWWLMIEFDLTRNRMQNQRIKNIDVACRNEVECVFLQNNIK
jgi:hypothetical protein